MGCWVMPNRSCAPRHWYHKCNVAFQSIRFCNAPGCKPGLRFQQKILFKLGFLKLALWIFGTYWIILCCQGCSVYCKMFSSLPGLSLLDAIASAPLSRCDKQMSPAIAKCPLGAESAQFGPNGLKLADGGPYQWGIQVTFWWSGLIQELHLSYLQQRCIITRGVVDPLENLMKSINSLGAERGYTDTQAPPKYSGRLLTICSLIYTLHRSLWTSV